MFWYNLLNRLRVFLCENADVDIKTSLKKKSSQIYSPFNTENAEAYVHCYRGSHIEVSHLVKSFNPFEWLAWSLACTQKNDLLWMQDYTKVGLYLGLNLSWSIEKFISDLYNDSVIDIF